MKTRTWLLVGGITLALTLAFFLGSAVMAQTTGNGTTPTATGMMLGRGNGRGQLAGQGTATGRGQLGNNSLMGPDYSLMTVAAQQFGMDRTALRAELQAGKTIAQAAAERGVASDTIVNAFIELRSDRLTQLVQAGRITQADADRAMALAQASAPSHINLPWKQGGYGLKNCELGTNN